MSLFSDIGPVVFERSRKAKKINISIKSGNMVRVAVPYGIAIEKAHNFVKSKASWIKENLVKVEGKINLANKIKDIDREYAKNFIIKRLEYLSNLYSFNYKSVSIRDQKTRWGSCSNLNNISLNIKLVCLPKELMDYVILHELTHTKVKNHSASFWKLLTKYVPDARKIDRKLKGYALNS